MAGTDAKSGGRRGRGPLVSQRTAVTVIAVLFGASAAGWLTTEFVPPDFPAHRALYADRWGEWTASAVDALRLYDPFHSFWFSGVLALFFVVLSLCLAGRWRSFLGPSLRLPAPGPLPARGDGPGFEVRFDGRTPAAARADPLAHYGKRHGAPRPLPAELAEEALSLLRRVLRKRGYRLAWRREGETVLFSAVAGRWRALGNFIFHAGLLVITIGGVIGSRMGSSEILYGARGDLLPLAESGLSIRVDDFRIVYAENGMIRDYISDLTILDEKGTVVAAKEIEVNHPLRHAGYTILQSSYSLSEDEFEWADLAVTPAGGGPPVEVHLVPGERAAVPGTGLTVKAGRFNLDLRRIPGMPRSMMAVDAGPALELVFEGPQGVERGWILPRYPAFDTGLTLVRRVVVADLEPRYYTGLEISVNPGAPVLVWGMVMASAGLLALLLWHHRVLRGRVDAEGIAAIGTHARWKVSFRAETGRIADELAAGVSGSHALRRKD